MPSNPLTGLPMSALSRRGFLTVGAASGLLLAGCGAGPGSQSKGVGGFTGKAYDGPKLSLAYWNGFTGGDGPAMKALVSDFVGSHDKVQIKSNTIQWADFYQRLPAATKAGKGPDVGAMHLDQLATNAARKVIVPLDDLASSLDLAEKDFAPSGLGSGHLPGQALRHSARRPHDRDVLQQGALQEGRHHRGAHRRGEPGGGVQEAPEGRLRAPVLDAEPVAVPPDVPLPALAVRRPALRRGRLQGDVRRRRRHEGADLDAGAGGQGLQPGQRRHRRPVRRVQERQELDHLGRHLADQRPRRVRARLRDRRAAGGRRRAGRVGQLAQLLHDRAGGRRHQPGQRREDLHRLDVRPVGGLVGGRHDPGPQLGPRGEGVHRVGPARHPRPGRPPALPAAGAGAR